MRKNKHPTEIPGYEGKLSELVDFIVGQLRFDRTQEFHRLLSERYFLEYQKERVMNHPKVSNALLEISVTEKLAAEKVGKLWKICEPYTEQ